MAERLANQVSRPAKVANHPRLRRRQIWQVKRSVTRSLFSIVCRFHGVDTKIVHILANVPYDCGSSNKNDLRAAEIPRPRRRSSSPKGEDSERLTQRRPNQVPLCFVAKRRFLRLL
jgi:hypothetical protein